MTADVLSVFMIAAAAELNPVELLLNNAVAGGIIATILIWRVLVTKAEMVEKLEAAETRRLADIEAERRIAAFHENAALTEREGRMKAQTALEASVEHGKLTLSLMAALRNVGGDTP